MDKRYGQFSYIVMENVNIFKFTHSKRNANLKQHLYPNTIYHPVDWQKNQKLDTIY